MIVTVCTIAILALVVVGLGCLRISEWHTSESDYWSHIHLLVLMNPALDAQHRPVLEWARANRPGYWERLRGWQEPPARMRAAS